MEISRQGRIPQSVNLPSAWIFTKEGVFKTREDLEAMAAGTVGKDKSAEITTCCDTGRLGAGWWFVLSEVSGVPECEDARRVHPRVGR